MPKIVNMVKKSGRYVAASGVGAAVVSVAGSAMAALDATQLTSIQDGINGADTNYFAIGGTILIVLAGIWGFKMVKGLIR